MFSLFIQVSQFVFSLVILYSELKACILPPVDGNINVLSTNFTKWLNTLKQFIGKLPTNCLSVFDDFVGLALKGLSHVTQTYISMLFLVNRQVC